MIIRNATRDEFKVAVDWAAAEGWNPGLDDLDAFFAADPNGFLMGFEGDDPISSISVVRYGEDYGFLGFYIVRGDKRGTGAGMVIWEKGLDYLKGRTVGLDGVVAQQENYRKSGFVYADGNSRYSGRPDVSSVETSALSQVTATDIAELAKWERRFFPADRTAFLSRWLAPDVATRHSLLVRENGAILGYGTIRQCRSGYKIGPLFAEKSETADILFCALAKRAEGDEVILDVPNANTEAVALAKRYQLAPSFETARMYLGSAPDTDIKKTFGVTTFELG
ncbi:MAG: GNAT family N-acetyltransferase [Pseudomonadota bacterium]